MELSEFFVALLELHWIYYLTKFGCWMRLPCHRELHGNVGNFWISMHILDIYGYPWISMDFHGFPWISIDYHGLPQISIDFLTNQKYSWISMDPGNLQIHGKSKIFRISTGNPNYHWVSHTKCETRKTYHSALRAHIFYTSSKGKTVGVEFQQILLFFISHKAKTTKNQNHQAKTKKNST